MKGKERDNHFISYQVRRLHLPYAHIPFALGTRRYMYVRMSILFPMYVREPRAECLGWTTYRALRYIRTCTYVCRGSSVLLNITHKIVDSGNTLPTQCTTMGGKTLTLVFSNTCHTCPLMSALLQVNEYLHKLLLTQ